MKITDLHPKLQQLYKPGMECGVIKKTNIYYVIPPPPPVELPENFSYKLVGDASVS